MTLEQLRKERGMTQIQLAEKLGISQAHLSDMESGKKNISERVRARLSELGFSKPSPSQGGGKLMDVASVPFIDISASAGRGIINFEEFPAQYPLNISHRALGLEPSELKECFVIKASGRSMSPAIDNGDLIFIRQMAEVPRYLEGICLVNYDGELYVKSIQLDHSKLIMKSINKEFDDIIIPRLENSDVHLQIVGRVLVVIKHL